MREGEGKYTKGPWNRFPSGYAEASAVAANNGTRVVADCGSSSNPENVANARLIASAPDLLEALEAALTILEDANREVPAMEWLDDEWRKGGDGLTALGRIRAALSRAKGE